MVFMLFLKENDIFDPVSKFLGMFSIIETFGSKLQTLTKAQIGYRGIESN